MHDAFKTSNNTVLADFANKTKENRFIHDIEEFMNKNRNNINVLSEIMRIAIKITIKNKNIDARWNTKIGQAY